MTQFIIVNENDEIIGYKNREDILTTDIYRVSALWITNSDGDILLAQRSFTKKKHPGKWGPAVAGTVEEGESYEENVYKEAKEEIGLGGFVFEKDIKLRISNEYNYFTQWFTSKIDKDESFFKKQDEEVEEIKWFKRSELEKEVKENLDKFLNAIVRCLEIFK
jgi:isopentenyldiphosphate isomerase